MTGLETPPQWVAEHGESALADSMSDSAVLRVLARASLSAREEESRRIARELHDEAGQLLSAVFLALDEVAPELTSEGRVRMEKARELLRDVGRRLRRLSHELRPMVLDDLGLVPALEFLSEGMSARCGIPVVVSGDSGGRLPAPVETAAYRIAQEALTNVARHARARSASVNVRRAAGALVLRVHDDGIGFDPRAAREGSDGGAGLIGIRERLMALSGRLQIDSGTGGTELLAEIPVGDGPWAAVSS